MSYRDKCEQLFEDHNKLKREYEELIEKYNKLQTVVHNITVIINRSEDENGEEN